MDTNIFPFRFQCSTPGKQFLSGQTFYKHLTATCQANKTWSLSTIPDPCECELSCYLLLFTITAGSHCVKPPKPDSKYNLQLQWNKDYPPAHGETVLYICNAGTKWNRFENNFNQWNMTLTCEEKNVFSGEPNIQWPTCLDGKYVLS